MSVPGGFTGPLVNTAVVDAPADIVDATPGNNQATDTNQMAVPPTVQLAKSSPGGTGAFGYAMANLLDASDSITTATAGAVSNSALVSTVVDPSTAVTRAAEPPQAASTPGRRPGGAVRCAVDAGRRRHARGTR